MSKIKKSAGANYDLGSIYACVNYACFTYTHTCARARAHTHTHTH